MELDVCWELLRIASLTTLIVVPLKFNALNVKMDIGSKPMEQ